MGSHLPPSGDPVRAVDLFCGAGGTSTGLALACNDLQRPVELTACNHWDKALATHERNHPWARHLSEPIQALDPRDVVPGGRLDLLVASPECTHHSVARGGRPVNDQSRTSAWFILRWLELLDVDHVIIENVPEFRNWGPVGPTGRPVKRLQGQTYKAWRQALWSLGYAVEDRVLNAADYGDATCRRRLFIQAHKGGPLSWPVQSHSQGGEIEGTASWRTAREIIDWSLPGQSIFSRKKPLAEKTMTRILRGLELFGGPAMDPFLVKLRGTSTAASVNDPLPTITAGGGHLALAQPFLVQVTHGGRLRSIDEPVPTVTAAHRGELGVVQPFLLPPDGFYGGDASNPPRSIDRPMQTVTQRGGGHLVQPFLVQYNSGSDEAHSVEKPLPTVTTRDRLGLVQPSVDGWRLDVRFRMLQPHELAAAMSFPREYAFAGNKADVVKQIGNAVAVNVSKALCHSALSSDPVTLSDYATPIPDGLEVEA